MTERIPAMPSKKVKRKETIRRILDTAAEVFAEVGFAGARMDNIAERSGVNKATIYYHIGDKHTLYTRVLHELFASAGDLLDMAIQQSSSPEEQLSVYIQQIAQILDQNPYRAIMMLREITDRVEHIPQIIIEDLVVIISKLGKILSEGEKHGQFIHVNPFTLQFMIIGAFILYKVNQPVRKKIVRLLGSAAKPDATVSGMFADEVERLVLKAIKKESEEG
jgi:AcrR family transcriptional regulator